VSGEERGIAGARAAALREAAVILALGLAAVVWLIPAQTTSGPVLGLSPAFLPTLCAVAIIALTVVGLALRLWQPEPLRPERLSAVWPAAMVAGVAIAGVLVLQLAGRFLCGLVIMVLGLAVLGERRIPVLLITLAGTCLVLGAVFQVWR
jgi:hypothetical protein